jgi:carboxyl-terminal processing protease
MLVKSRKILQFTGLNLMIITMIKQVFLYAAAFFLLAGSACASDSTRVAYKAINPEEQQAVVLQAIKQLMSSYHYNKIKIDDQFSSKALDNYIKHLDPSRMYFIESDIKSFEKYRYELDNSAFDNNIQPVFDIYNVYQQRLKERINYALEVVKRDFDFTTNDSTLLDREHAPWCKDTAEENREWYKRIKYECLTLRATGKDFKSYSETVRKRYENLDKQISKTKSEDVFSLFANSLAELADPHTNYFSPRNAEDFNTTMSLSLEGIGAQLRTDGEYTKVMEIIKGAPAD